MKKLLVCLVIFMMSSSLFAQQDALFSQYMFNKLSLNPAYAGSREVLSTDLIYRYQWVGMNGAPKTLSASLHSPLNNPHLALGLNIYNDRIGPMSNSGVMGTFAYRIIFPKSKLSFGLSFGAKKNDIIWNEINAYDKEDPFLLYPLEKKVVPDANFGIYYYSNKFFIGVSSKQLLQNQTLYTEDQYGNSQFTKLVSHFYGMTGCAVPVNDYIIFRPSILVKYVKNSPLQMDLNTSFLFYETLWLGISYRTENALSLITEINVNQNFRIGYSYDIWLNELKVYNKGSHEIRLSFDINVQKRLLSPRYF